MEFKGYRIDWLWQEKHQEDVQVSGVDNCVWMISCAVHCDRKKKKNNEFAKETIPRFL